MVRQKDSDIFENYDNDSTIKETQTIVDFSIKPIMRSKVIVHDADFWKVLFQLDFSHYVSSILILNCKKIFELFF